MGGARYAQTICAGLASRGHDVVLFCAAHGDAPALDHVDGYRIVRSGGRVGVYPSSLMALHRDALRTGRFDVITIDTQNGVPFWSPLVSRTPVISLVHHVHREQWPVVFGPVMSRSAGGSNLERPRSSTAAFRASPSRIGVGRSSLPSAATLSGCGSSTTAQIVPLRAARREPSA